MGIYGKRDIIVNPNQRLILKQGVPQAEISWYEDAGHFPMLDAPERFIENLRTFLHTKYE
jgi:pimeloyl-ACP methyl ester carboxylesterase